PSGTTGWEGWHSSEQSFRKTHSLARPGFWSGSLCLCFTYRLVSVAESNQHTGCGAGAGAGRSFPDQDELVACVTSSMSPFRRQSHNMALSELWSSERELMN